MKVFLFAGLLYLAGIAVVLLIKPTLMFRNDGTWKEFGVGRSQDNYTWLPFWLFCIFWALISYVSSLLLVRIFVGKDTSYQSKATDIVPQRRARRGSELPQGYYILDKPVMPGQSPTYVYLGPQA